MIRDGEQRGTHGNYDAIRDIAVASLLQEKNKSSPFLHLQGILFWIIYCIDYCLVTSLKMAPDPTNKWRMGNVKTVGYCTFCIVLIGFGMLLAGAITSGIAYTEVRPNIADENYERYIRSDLKRVVGPIMLAFGLVCIVGGCLFFGLTLCSATMENRRRVNKTLKYNVRASEEHLASTPDVKQKMLSDV